MKALEISINGGTPIIASADNLIYVDLMYGYPNDRIIVRGCDYLHSFIWFDGEPEESHQSFLKKVSATVEDNDDAWKRKLEIYYRLKKVLEDENLI